MKASFKQMLTGLNIRQRLTFQFLILISILFLFFSISIYFFSKLYLTNRFYTRLQERAVIASSLYLDLSASQSAIQDIVRKNQRQALADEMVSIYDPDIDQFLFSTEFLREEFHRQFINSKDTLEVINNINYKDFKVSVLKIKEYWVIISAIDYWSQEALHDLRDILVIICFVALLFIAYISWYMADKALAPIETIGVQLEKIFPENLSQRVTYSKNNDEITVLAEIINQLLQRVEESVKGQKMFVSNISHELKNPLTKIFTQIELLELKYRDNPEYHEKLLSLRSDTLALNYLTQSLLELANAYTNESDLPKELHRIDEVLIEAVSEYKRWHPDDHIVLLLDDMPENEKLLVYEINQPALKIVFKNLIENACKFSNNQTVEVTVYMKDDLLEMRFFNEGNPIPESEIGNILQPFYRSNATAKGKHGHGVGLAITNQILHIHNFLLNISTEADGNNFVIVFRRS